MAEERKQFLKQRFGQREEKVTEPTSKAKKVDRRRHSLYLANDLVERMDKAYKDAAHTLYPVDIDKADFMEACLAFALDHQAEILSTLKK